MEGDELLREEAVRNEGVEQHGAQGLVDGIGSMIAAAIQCYKLLHRGLQGGVGEAVKDPLDGAGYFQPLFNIVNGSYAVVSVGGIFLIRSRFLTEVGWYVLGGWCVVCGRRVGSVAVNVLPRGGPVGIRVVIVFNLAVGGFFRRTGSCDHFFDGRRQC